MSPADLKHRLPHRALPHALVEAVVRHQQQPAAATLRRPAHRPAAPPPAGCCPAHRPAAPPPAGRCPAHRPAGPPPAGRPLELLVVSAVVAPQPGRVPSLVQPVSSVSTGFPPWETSNLCSEKMWPSFVCCLFIKESNTLIDEELV